jgi:hypothetical protein
MENRIPNNRTEQINKEPQMKTHINAPISFIIAVLTIGNCALATPSPPNDPQTLRLRDLCAGRIIEVAGLSNASFDAAVGFLTSTDDVTVISAVRRLTRIGGPNGIEAIVTNFYQRPYYDSGPPSYGVAIDAIKLETLRALGRLESRHQRMAKEALLGIAQHYWNTGPQTSRWVGLCEDREFNYVIAGACHQLQRWADDDEVVAFVQQVLAQPDAGGKLARYRFRPYVYKLKEAGVIRKAGITNLYDVATNILHSLHYAASAPGNTSTWYTTWYDGAQTLLYEIPTPILSNIHVSAEADIERYGKMQKLTDEEKKHMAYAGSVMENLGVHWKQPPSSDWDMFGPLD